MSKKNKKNKKNKNSTVTMQLQMVNEKVVIAPVPSFVSRCWGALTGAFRATAATASAAAQRAKTTATAVTSSTKTRAVQAVAAARQKLSAAKQAVVARTASVYKQTVAAVTHPRTRAFVASVILSTGVMVVAVILGTLAGLAAGGLALVAGASPMAAQMVHFVVAMVTSFFVVGGIAALFESHEPAYSPAYSFAQ